MGTILTADYRPFKVSWPDGYLASATPGDAASSPPMPSSCATRASVGSIELDFAGARLRLRGTVDQESLVALLTALRSLA